MAAAILELAAPEEEVERLLPAARHAHETREPMRIQRLEASLDVRGVVVDEEDSYAAYSRACRAPRSLTHPKTSPD